MLDFSGGTLHLKDFYRGCIHTGQQNLFLIGFARPVIGNIPSISEMQARYAIGILSGKYTLPAALKEIQNVSWDLLCAEYSTIDTGNVYPVEQFPYCDDLARDMGILPTLAAVKSPGVWLKIMFLPASTLHYVDEYFDRQLIEQQKVYTPLLLIALLILMRIFGYPFRLINRLCYSRKAHSSRQ